ncbi:MAG: hypothetical protein KAV87_37140 [Desulfobacteraceae bacterium]|nr:hypothetical protein [Desulfobacteraceae bacterium]
MKRNDRRRYQAYLLRLWREPYDEKWHVIIEEPQSGERQAFSDVKEFITFLESFVVSEDGRR